jgi:hypothetical protein
MCGRTASGRCAVPVASSVLVAAAIYAMLTMFFFDMELRATLVARRSGDLPPWLLQEGTLGAETRWGDASKPIQLSARDGGSPNNSFSVSERPTAKSAAQTDGLTTSDGGANASCAWVDLKIQGPPYFLTVVLIVRIYEKDLSELTSLDVKNWLFYVRYAGVEHVYLYDLWTLPGESQKEQLEVFVREGFVTYFDRHETHPYELERSQHSNYQHCIDNFGKDTRWQVAIDIDEYPFALSDTEPGFLARYIKKFKEEHPAVSEITMANFLYLGQKNNSKELLFDKLWRHTHHPANNLVKPIYRTADVKKATVHHNIMSRGESKTAPTSELRMNHYWGARLQNWGPDTEETLANTEEDRGMEPIVASFKTCKRYIQHYL